MADAERLDARIRPAPLPPNPAFGGLSIHDPSTPGLGDDPATVYNFDGLVGRAIVLGTGVGNGVPYYTVVDMGFARGRYVSTAGNTLSGDFVFSWMDVFTDAARLNQIHDIHPGNGGVPGSPSGLFWTFQAPSDFREASDFRASDSNGKQIVINEANLLDFFQFFAPAPAEATLSFIADFSGNLGAVHLNETSNGSRFIFDGVKSNPNIAWKASTQISADDSRPFVFESSGPNTVIYAVLGHERNGVFA